MSATIRAEVDLPQEVVTYLTSEAQKRNVTPAEILVEAIGTDRYLRDRAKDGAEILVRGGGTNEKVLLKGV